MHSFLHSSGPLCFVFFHFSTDASICISENLLKGSPHVLICKSASRLFPDAPMLLRYAGTHGCIKKAQHKEYLDNPDSNFRIALLQYLTNSYININTGGGGGANHWELLKGVANGFNSEIAFRNSSS